jgi:hypothetical protein
MIPNSRAVTFYYGTSGDGLSSCLSAVARDLVSREGRYVVVTSLKDRPANVYLRSYIFSQITASLPRSDTFDSYTRKSETQQLLDHWDKKGKPVIVFINHIEMLSKEDCDAIDAIYRYDNLHLSLISHGGQYFVPFVHAYRFRMHHIPFSPPRKLIADTLQSRLFITGSQFEMIESAVGMSLADVTDVMAIIRQSCDSTATPPDDGMVTAAIDRVINARAADISSAVQSVDNNTSVKATEADVHSFLSQISYQAIPIPREFSGFKHTLSMKLGDALTDLNILKEHGDNYSWARQCYSTAFHIKLARAKSL